jgi:hypothetical protein
MPNFSFFLKACKPMENEIEWGGVKNDLQGVSYEKN